jgi:hypothetical protein
MYRRGSSYEKPAPYWVCLKRQGETMDPTPHIVYGVRRPYSAPTYRTATRALCGAPRGRHGWRAVQRQDNKKLPENYCEMCWRLSIVEQLK